MKRNSILLFMFLIMAAALCSAQPAPTPTPAPAQAPAEFNIWKEIQDPNNLAPATFLLANIADAKTDWHITVAGRLHTITPAQRLSFVGSSLFVSLVVKHYWPKTAKPMNIAMMLGTAYFAGRAYANGFQHGVIPTVPGPVK